MRIDEIERLAIQAKYDESDVAIENREIDRIYSFCFPDCVFESSDGEVYDVTKGLSLWREIYEMTRDLKSREKIVAFHLNGNEAKVESTSRITAWINPSQVPWLVKWLLSIPLTIIATHHSIWIKTQDGWLCKFIKSRGSKNWFGFLPLKNGLSQPQ